MPRITALALLLATLATGCAAPTAFLSTPAYSKYTLEQVVQWSKEGQAPGRIVARLEAARAFYPLTAGELVSLRDQGVSVEVLDYLLDSYVGTLRREERFGFNRRVSAAP